MPFFEVIGNEEANSPRTRVATAGLLTLRLVDHWILAGMVVVGPESVSVRSVREAIANLSHDDPSRGLLFGLVNTMQTARSVDLERIVPRLRAYARLLEGEPWAANLAADVHRTVSRLMGEQCDDENTAAEFIIRLLRLAYLPHEP
jgi:hypothetical protein